jgi:hypothetical protein
MSDEHLEPRTLPLADADRELLREVRDLLRAMLPVRPVYPTQQAFPGAPFGPNVMWCGTQVTGVKTTSWNGTE